MPPRARRRRRSLLAFIAGALVILAGGVGVVWYIMLASDPNVAFNNVAAALATLAIVSGFVKLMWRRYGPEPPDSPDIASIDRLARSLGAQWREEVTNRRIHSSDKIEVRWRLSNKHIPGGLEQVRTASMEGLDPPPIPGATALDGSWDERTHEIKKLHTFYARLPHGRLVILGAAGTGKSCAMILLLIGRSSFARRQTLPTGKGSRCRSYCLWPIGMAPRR